MSKRKDEGTSRFSMEGSLAETGIRIIHDKRLDDRIEQIKELRNSLRKPLEATEPIGQLEELETRLYDLDEFLRKNAIPWCRAGTEEKFAKALRSWEKLMRVAIDGINTIKGSIKEEGREWGETRHARLDQLIERAEHVEGIEPEDKKEIVEALQQRKQNEIGGLMGFDQTTLVDLLRSFLEVEIFPYGLMISDTAYTNRDVSPATAIIVNQPPTPYGYVPGASVQPTSGGRISDQPPREGPRPKMMPNKVHSEEGEEDEE